MTLDTEYFKFNTQLLHDKITKMLELHILDKDLRNLYEDYEKENSDKTVSFDLWLFNHIATEQANNILGSEREDYLNNYLTQKQPLKA